MRRLTFAAAVGGALAGVLVFAVMASATRQAQQALPQTFGKGFQAQMTGSNETPPGDPDGSGTALIRLDPQDGLVCFELTVSGIDPAVAAHIHHAPAGQPGAIVVPLVAPAQATGESKGCVQADPALIQDIAANPSQYYVNVHNPAFPAGAVRGQLTPLNEAPLKPKVIVKTKVVHVHDCKGKKKHH
jgi:CHRD domain